MLTLWPELLAYQFLAIGIVRIVVGYLFLSLGVRGVRALARADAVGWRRSVGYGYALVQCAVGGALLIGWWVQPTALAGAATMAALEYAPTARHPSERHLTLLLGTVSLALIFLGPGAYALDLPL